MKSKILVLIIMVSILSCVKPIPRKPVVRNSSTFLKESIERNKMMNKFEDEVFLELMKNDSTHNYINSANGFWYYYVTKDSIPTKKLPTSGDEVFYSYNIKDIDGELLYSEEDLGERSYLVDKQELITGLQDGLKLMKEGEVITFLFPSYKAYSYSGYKKIGSNQPLIYTVRLKKIIFNNQ